MANIPYINYKEMKEFYTIPEVCKLFKTEKSELKAKCSQYSIQPKANEIGEFGLVRYDVRKLHNAIYHESDGNAPWEADPWA